jgi:hypothetical protein
MVEKPGSGIRRPEGRGANARVGIALSATEIRAVDVRARGKRSVGGDGWRAPLEPPDNGSWPSLANALTEMATALQVSGGSLVVALLPPLTEVRSLELPPLRDEELNQLLSRNAARYFLNAREPQIVGAAAVARKRAQTTGPVVGAAAPARLIGAIEAAARGAGWTIDAIVPAESGWRAAAVSLWPTYARGTSHLLVHLADRTDLLRLEDGQLAGVRRFRPGAVDAELIAEIIGQSRNNGTAPRVAAIGAANSRDELSRALSTRGATVTLPPGDWASNAEDAALIAASFAAPNEELALRTEAARQIRAQRFRYLSVSVAAAAVLLFVGAAWLELHAVRAEVTRLQDEQRRLAPQLLATRQGQQSFNATYGKLAFLLNAERTAPHWGAMLARVTDNLSADAYVVAFRTRGDTLLLEGRATNAAPILNQLMEMPGIANPRITGQIQRDAQRNGPTLDRWNFAAERIPPAPPRKLTPNVAGRGAAPPTKAAGGAPR